ncbi:MAG TPA: pilus assembly protein TadB [Acidimicrobiia bacterium]|nr:pilus assembly protein TadB [Acidimicrobiia bacterium]
MTTTAMLFGGAIGVGILVVAAGLAGARGSRLHTAARTVRQRATARAGAAVVCSVVAFLATGWLVGGVLAGLAVVSAPRLAGRSSADAVQKAEAVAGWAEMLRDTMAAAAGIEAAIVHTAPLAPTAIRPAVQRLAARLDHEHLVPSLRRFADDLADPSADLVVAALVLAVERRARDLGALLGALAEAARGEAAMILRVEAGRARLRTAVRVVSGFTLAFAAGMVLLNRAYLDPFDTATGQLVLVLVGGCFAAALWQLDRMARLDVGGRVFRAGAGATA